MFVRREVRGVRSSWPHVLDQPPLVLLGLREADQHTVEGTPQPALVPARDRHLDAQMPGPGHVLRRPRQLHEPPGLPPRQPPPEQPGRDDDAGDEQQGPLLQLPQQVLGVAELLRDLHGTSAAAERDGHHPVAVVADLDLAVLDHHPGQGRVGRTAVRVANGQAGGALLEDLPARAEHLDVRTTGADQVVARTAAAARREVLRRQRVLLDQLPQITHDLGEHGLLVDPHQPRRRAVAEDPDEDGDDARHRHERHGEGRPQ